MHEQLNTGELSKIEKKVTICNNVMTMQRLYTPTEQS